MRLTPLAIAALGGTFASPVSAQCPVSSWGYGIGAIDRGRAILSGTSQGNVAVRFFAKSPTGWAPESTFFVIGDLQIIYDSPVAIDGVRAIGGSPESASQRGRAFVFERGLSQWTAVELDSPNVGLGDFFGAQVDIDGDVAVVGADHWVVGGGDGIGRAHVFERLGGVWTETALLATHPLSVAVEGTTIVVGDKMIGGVQVYERLAGTWTWVRHLDTVPSGSFPRLGSSVALQGDTLVAGAASPGIVSYVEVFRRVPSGVWTRVQRVVASDAVPNSWFGASVALSGSTLLVGAPGDAQGGRVHRYEFDGASYVPAGSFGPEPGGQYFGRALSFQREDAIISSFSGTSFYRLGFAETTAFCPTVPNSTGRLGALAAEGCDSLSGSRLTLVASHLPRNALGLVFFGPTTTQLPMGDGFRCIGAGLHRLPVAAADASGTLVHDFDFASWPGSLVTAGRTWYFQALHRDPGSSGTGLNLTNALAIRITP